MINYTSNTQLSLFEFKTPFSDSLNPDNRWVKLSKVVPWDKFANFYMHQMDSTIGRPGKNPRLVLGALIIKHKLKLSDRETIDQIQENVYLQFFVGLKEFQTKPIFDHSLFVSIRKRIGPEIFDTMTVDLMRSIDPTFKNVVYDNTDDDDQSKPNDDTIGNQSNIDVSSTTKEHSVSKPNKGSLQIDATVADQYITHPTDSKLLNTCRKKMESMIDYLYQKAEDLRVKPRTYRRKVDRQFLEYSKKKRKSKKQHRKMVRLLLGCVKRNLLTIEKLLQFHQGQVVLSKQDQTLLETIKEIYIQQKHMYDNKTHSVPNRIVNLFQPHVRPIPRGKQKAQIEFGCKLGVSLDQGFARVDTFSWEAYHEGSDLIKQTEQYYKTHGFYPKLVLADKAYHSRENRAWLKERGIEITAKALGRKKKLTPYQKAKKKKQFAQRNHIEAKFGQGKNGYNLNQIRAKRKDTSETWIACIFFIMNLVNCQKMSSFGLYSFIKHLNNSLYHCLISISDIFIFSFNNKNLSTTK